MLKETTMIKNLFYKLFAACFSLLVFTGCDLELQRNYDYESSVIDPHIKMTAWEFLHTRTDIFSTLIEALEYTGLDHYYKQTDNLYTFLALDNTALKNYMMDRFPGTKNITECDQKTVTDMLLYHIVDGDYSGYGQLQVEPMFVLTLLKGEAGLMTMLVRKNPWQADAGKIIVNDAGSNGNSPQRAAVTSNIMPTNGVIHVFNTYCYYKK